MKKPQKQTPYLRGAAAVLAAARVLMCGRQLAPVFSWLLGKAALFTAVLDMPQGALCLLREHYSGSLLPPDESKPPTPPEPAPPPPPDETPPPQDNPPPPVPEQYRGVIREVTYRGEDTPAYALWHRAWIRNYTELSREEIAKALEPGGSVRASGGKKPEILIFHTHATESFEPCDRAEFDRRSTWRDADNSRNMVAVGEVLAGGLRKAGLAVLHDSTQHDNPSYNGAYQRSRATVQKYQKENPELRILLDLHRDAVFKGENETVKAVTEINGRKAAQLMVIAPYDDGTVGVPRWKENFRFAAEFTDRVEALYPGLMRPVFFCCRTYNYALSPGSLLFEFGTNANTLEEAKYTAELVAPVLAEYLTRP